MWRLKVRGACGKQYPFQERWKPPRFISCYFRLLIKKTFSYNKYKYSLSFLYYNDSICFYFLIPRVAPPQKKRNSRFFRTLLWSTVICLHLVPDRASFPHYNNTKIIKFGWELFILWIISYGLSFSGFARFPEFRGTINDSFSSTCANTYQHSKCYKEISVPLTWLDCKSLLDNVVCKSMDNTRVTEHNTRSIYGQPKLSLIVPQNSGNRANPENDSP